MQKELLEKFWLNNLATLPVGEAKEPLNVSTWKGGVRDHEAYSGAFGLGIACGKSSNSLECIDIDNHFGDAKDVLSEFLSEIDEIYQRHKFLVQSTTSGGYHLIYRCSEIEGNLKLASRPKWSSKQNRHIPDAIIETRGEGGYFVAAPTPGYHVVSGLFSDIPEITPEERSEMIQIAKTFNKWYETRPTEHEEANKPGDMYNNDPSAIEDLTMELQNAGWFESRQGMWRRPDKDRGISATLGKVAENVFYVFSSNAYPFEPNRAYKPFSAVGLLRYGGDFKKFAIDLSAIYGKSKPKTTYSEIEQRDVTDKSLEALMRKAYIDMSVPVAKPPVCFSIWDFETGEVIEKRLLTLGNFSAIIGKSKSKKSFLASVLMAAAIKGGDINRKIVSQLPPGKSGVLHIDTEQARYDAYTCADRAIKLAGVKNPPNFKPFDLRQSNPSERCAFVGYALKKFRDHVGYVVIDGLADLARSYNDEDEATRLVALLMQWTSMYNIHITVVIHQNKANDFAMGWVGTRVMQKAECVFSVTKDPEDRRKSVVRNDFMRGVSEFNDFEIEIEPDGIPRIGDVDKLDSNYPRRSLNF